MSAPVLWVTPRLDLRLAATVMRLQEYGLRQRVLVGHISLAAGQRIDARILVAPPGSRFGQGLQRFRALRAELIRASL